MNTFATNTAAQRYRVGLVGTGGIARAHGGACKLLECVELVAICDLSASALNRYGDEFGVSQRYLSLLLQSTGTTFSELVWTQRLEMARAWLERSDPRDIAISEIAYGVGFKSTAHFSRKFKRAFGQNPSELRMNVETLRDVCLDTFSGESAAALRWAELN